MRLDLKHELVADLFAAIIFLCNDLLKVKVDSTGDDKTSKLTRFLAVAKQLPFATANVVA